MAKKKRKQHSVVVLKALQQRSGQFVSKRPLVAFLYDLMRDHLPAGTVEDLVEDAEYTADCNVVYCNGWLAQYATDLADRLLHEPDEEEGELADG